MAQELFTTYKQLIDSCVCVRGQDATAATGMLYSIDPVSGNVALLDVSEEETRLTVLLGHTIVSIESAEEESEPTLMEQMTATTTNLAQHDIPFTVKEANGELYLDLYDGAAQLRPPFTSDALECNEEEMTCRIRELL